MAELQKHMDPATLGPIGFLSKSIGSSLAGIGQMMKSPKILLPTIFLSGVWLALSYLKLMNPDSELVKMFSFLTFAQGGMYAGPLGAIGGVIGKALISYLATSILMPLLTRKAKQKSLQMKVGQAFKINGARGFALFLSGIGIAFILYNFKTGNGTTENSAIAVASIIGVFRSLKNPRGFIVEFIRSFSKGNMPRKKASNFGAGLIIGYLFSISIAFATQMTGPQWYLLGLVFLILSMIIALLFKNRRRTARTMSVLFIGLLVSVTFVSMTNDFGVVQAQGQADIKWQEPFEAYGFSAIPGLESTLTQQQYDYYSAIRDNQPTGIRYTPIAITVGQGASEKQVVSLNQIQVEVKPNESIKVPLESVSIKYREDKYDFSGEYEIISSGGQWSAQSDIQFDFEGVAFGSREGDPHVFYSGYDSQPGYVSFFLGAPDMYVSQYEFANLIDPNSLYAEIDLKFLVSEAKEDWQADFYGETRLLVKIDEITFDNTATPPQTNVTGKWVHEDTNYYAFVQQDSTNSSLEYFNGVFKDMESTNAGVEEDGNTLYHKSMQNNTAVSDYRAMFDPLPQSYDSQAQISIGVDVNATLNGGNMDQNEQNSRVVFSGLVSGRRAELCSMSDPNFFDAGVFSYEQGSFYGNMPQGVTQGQEVTIERILGTYMWPNAICIADTYKWEAQVIPAATESEDEESDENTSIPIFGGDWDNQDFGDYDWDDRADEGETGAINIVTAIGGLLGAGAAVAAGFGGNKQGPGNIRIPNGEYDPSDGTLIVTSPGGSQEIYKLNPETGEFESKYGSTLKADDIERANKELEIDKELAKNETQRVIDRTDGDTGYWKKQEQIETLKQKYITKSKDKDDKLSNHMANHLQRIQDDIKSGKGIDKKALEKLKNFHGKVSRGELANSGDIPGDYTNWQHAKDFTNLTSEEIARGETGLAISLRIVAGIATVGKSEFGFEIAKSVYKTKDYVDQGMDNWSDITQKLAVETIKEEGFGRLVGAGLNIGGKVVGGGAKIASKALRTTKIGNAIADGAGNIAGKIANKVGDFLGQDIVKTTKNIFGMTPKVANQTSKNLKSANAKLVKEAINAANKQLDDAIKAGSSQVDDAAKAISNQADDVAKAVSNQADDIAKQTDDMAKQTKESAEIAAKKAEAEAAAKQAETAEKAATAKKAETAAKQAEEKAARDLADPHKQATKKWDDAMNKGKQQAQDEIENFKKASKAKPEINKRDELFRRGQQIGDQKVENLKRIQERLKSHPNSKDAQDAYDEALRAIQKDKYAMNSLKEYNGPGANELRGNFNMRNEQHTQAALQNARERLAQEHGVNPEDIKFVEATNTPGAGGASTIDASRTAGKVDPSKYTNANFKGSGNADDIVSGSARIKGAPMDKDVTGRIFDRKTGEWIDLPKEDVGRIYNQELFKTHHNGSLPTTRINGKDVIDENAIKDFAKKMDHTVTDRTGADAFGRGDADLRNILNKQSTHVKEFDDITSVTKTMEYKSNEWFSDAKNMREKAMELAIDKNNKSAVDMLLIKAESTQAEGVRQMVKMFDDQVAQQVKAVAGSGKNIKIPEKLVKSVKILDQIGKPDGITMSQAEVILKNMNTSIEDVVQQSSSLMEVIAKFS